MEKLLFKSVKVWIVLLLVILAVPGVIAFGTVVRMTTEGNERFGPIGAAAVFLADVPVLAREIIDPSDRMQARDQNRFGDRAGWTLAPDATIPGYLLLSRYNGDLRRHEVSLVDLDDASTVANWPLDADKLLEGIPLTSPKIKMANMSTGYYRAIHPAVFPNGDVLIKDHQSPAIRMTPCGERVWHTGELILHHSTETDADGSLWIPGWKEPSQLRRVQDGFYDDTMVKLSPDGKLLFERSLIEAMVKAGYMALFFTAGTYSDDPAHLNDIQPVLEDGPHWKAGDLFLSLRHRSLLVLYRPSTDEILWMKMGPWMAQHDVDIVDDHTIAVFSNNAYDAGTGGYILGSNEVMLYDFETDTVTSPFKGALKTHEVRTLFEGLSEILPSGHLMVEEENAGRIVFIDPKDGLAAEFVNRAGDGALYRLGWSRYIGQAEGDALRAAMAAASCE